MATFAQRWSRALHASTTPAYLLIPQLITDDLRSGHLSPRDKLPTLRELAQMLDLNYTTVARAYAEARRRGLIDSKTGAGTFVKGQAPSLPLRNGTEAEMTMNMPPEVTSPALIQHLQASAARMFETKDFRELLRYQNFGGTSDDRAAAVKWLRRRLSGISSGQVLVCPGIHSVLMALISQLAKPGETICVDALAYPGLKAIASQLGVHMHPIPIDEAGPDIQACEHACRAVKPKAIYCNPTLLNPTTTTMSLARREVLAEVAQRFSVPIIEDDAYGMLPQKKLPPVATFAPELTYYITGFAKCFGGGLRTAYVCAPSEKAAQKLAGTLRAMTVMSSPVTNALTTMWVEDGTAQAVLDDIRQECNLRVNFARKALSDFDVAMNQDCFHLWVPVTKGWSPVELASYLRMRGLGAVASAAFSTDGDPPEAVRICLGGAHTHYELQGLLELLADTLAHPEHPHSTVA